MKGKTAAARRQVYQEALGFWKGRSRDPYEVLMAGICHLQLGEYPAAAASCRAALQGFLAQPATWLGTSEPQLLVESYVLPGEPAACYPQVRRDIEAYKLDYRGQAGMALYAYALVRLLVGEDADAAAYGARLGKIKNKWLVGLGATIEALSRRDQTGFEAALDSLLRAHNGMAKWGEIRESPEGYLSLAGMCLSRMALDRGLTVTVESEYLSPGYLNHLASLRADAEPAR